MKANLKIENKGFSGSALTATLLFALSLLICWLAAGDFMAMWRDDVLAPLPEYRRTMLSNYLPVLAGTPADTPVFIQDSGQPGAAVMVLGGTHPNEPSSFLSAVVLLENARVDAGRLIVIPFAMHAGFRHNFPQEASPSFIHFTLPDGSERVFRYGSRDMQHTLMWPGPDIYKHKPSGQELSGNENKNLNRSYPGDPKGTLAEQLGFAVMELIRKENVDLAFDLHEASPEYPVIDAIVAHEKSMELAAAVAMELKGMDIEIRLEPSPKNLRGLSHREWGDGTDTLPILMETANPSQGRLRGRTDEALVLTGKDKAYAKPRDIANHFIPYSKGDHPIAFRVARHLTAIRLFLEMLGLFHEGKDILVEGIPDYEDMISNGVGYYLKPLPAD